MRLVTKVSTKLMSTFEVDVISYTLQEYSRQNSDQLEALQLLNADCRMNLGRSLTLVGLLLHLLLHNFLLLEWPQGNTWGLPINARSTEGPASQKRFQHSQLHPLWSVDGRPVSASPRPLGNGLAPASSDYNAPNGAVSQVLYLA